MSFLKKIKNKLYNKGIKKSFQAIDFDGNSKNITLSAISAEMPSISILDKRFKVKTNGTDTTVAFESALKYAVTNGFKIIVPSSEYTVAGLNFPSNLNIHFSEGAKLILTPNSPADTRCVNISRVKNIRVSGALEIDGNMSTIKSGSEHMHGLFIYNVKDITIDKVYAYNCYGDNVSISGGSDNPGDYSENVNIGSIKAIKAGRKNLVIEHVDNLRISFAELDNSQGGQDGLGGNSLDIEPFEYTGNKKSFTIYLGKIITKGTGNDFTAGTTVKKAEGYVVNIEDMECTVLDLKTNDTSNASRWKSAIYSYAITLNIKKIVVHLANTRSNLSKDKLTEPTRALYIQHGAIININDMKVYGGCDSAPIIRIELGYDQPTVTINDLLLDCPISYGIKNERANLFIGNLRVQNLKDRVLYCDTMSNNTINIKYLYVENSCSNYIIYLSSGTPITTASIALDYVNIIDTRKIKVKYFQRIDNNEILKAIKLGTVKLPETTKLNYKI